MNAKPTIRERLTVAAQSSDLSHRETCCDVDWIHAHGVAACRERLGAALLERELAPSHGAERAVRAVVMQLTRELGRRHGWPMLPAKLHKIATEADRHYRQPACPACQGRGQVGVERQPREQRLACVHCQGTGRQRMGKVGVQACAHCFGKGQVRKLVAAPPYHPRACAKCDGSGQRPIYPKYQREVREVLHVMDAAYRRVGGVVRRVMQVREAD